MAIVLTWWQTSDVCVMMDTLEAYVRQVNETCSIYINSFGVNMLTYMINYNPVNFPSTRSKLIESLNAYT